MASLEGRPVGHKVIGVDCPIFYLHAMRVSTNFNYGSLLIFIACFSTTVSWPDGAPCLLAAYESMNPLEAVEHQGGLQLTPPPFRIDVDRECYWRNQPIALTITGNTTKTKFKGFAIQPIVWKGSKIGQRVGQFMRLDDNGSWQQQCFRKKDSVTHSHDEMKSHIKLWWKNDEDEEQYIQFVATVVVHLKQFWVKSVLSPPIPPCRIERRLTGGWTAPVIRIPPPVTQFKMDTWKLFNHESAGQFPRSISDFPGVMDSEKVETIPPTLATTTRAPIPVFETTVRTVVTAAPVFVPRPSPVEPVFMPRTVFRNNFDSARMEQTTMPPMTTRQTPPPTTTVFIPQTTQQRFIQPAASPIPIQTRLITNHQNPERQRQKLTHIIPLPNMELNKRRTSSTTNTRPTVSSISNSPRSPTIPRMIQLSRQITAQLAVQNRCVDIDLPSQCAVWFGYCGRSSYMEARCRRTCRYCS